MPPANQALTFGGFKITTTRLDDNPKYTVNKVKIENTGKVPSSLFIILSDDLYGNDLYALKSLIHISNHAIL